jgi:SAM-dependent methyltransferase
MANARGKAIDNTHLSIDLAEDRGFIHRDYIAHCLRWSHVVKYIMAKQNKRGYEPIVLDVGCGKEVPMAKLMYANRLTKTSYIGVDVNRLEPDTSFGKFEANIYLYGQTDFAKTRYDEANGEIVFMEGSAKGSGFESRLECPRPNIITCFEVLEHVEPKHTIAILKNIKELLSKDGRAFISTPCFNGSAADNHVNEITYEALGTLIQGLGFGIQEVYGTFASQKDIVPNIEEDGYGPLFEKLSNYFDSNMLSNIFANLYPWCSRNALWVLSKEPDDACRERNHIFNSWEELETPWTSSELWKELRDY